MRQSHDSEQQPASHRSDMSGSQWCIYI